MMNPIDYINSGAIEACIMGLADDQEMALLAQMEMQYPEVKAAREHMEKELETAALKNAVLPGDALKDRIKNTLQSEKLIADQPIANNEMETAVPVKKSSPELPPAPKPIRWFRTALAASVLLLMGSVLLNFYYFSKFAAANKRYDALAAQQNALVTQRNALQASMRMIKSPDMKQVIMNGMPESRDMMATIYWDTHSKDVYLMVNNLPAPAIGKQYQLWAQVQGKMIDAGLLTWTEDGMLVKMGNVPAAEAFAISLENEGGTKTPTLQAVKVLGKV